MLRSVSVGSAGELNQQRHCQLRSCK